MSADVQTGGVRIVLPATSANLGPGFDAVGLAMSMHLTVEAKLAPAFVIEATGRDAELCAVIERNLILDTYREVLQRAGCKVVPLHLKLHNEIPLGMGCGSSAAALLAGVVLADYVGVLHLGEKGIVAEASRREGHPDNVAACWYGGFTVSAQSGDEIEFATFPAQPAWEMLLALPGSSLATKEARALLPEQYSKADAVFNVQRVALLAAAFAQGKMELLKTAMQDRIHQPYREAVCPLLKLLLPVANEAEIAGVVLSGAGPSVLVFLGEGTPVLAAETRLRTFVGGEVELISLRMAGGATVTLL